MAGTGDLAAQLEQKRRRARRSYLVYGGGLLSAVLMAFAADILWAGVVFAVTVLLNLLVCRRDVAGFRRDYREARIRRGCCRYFRESTVVDKNLFTLDQAAADGCLPLGCSGGVVRVGINGTLKNRVRAELADVAFPISVGEKGKKRILSGCYMRFGPEERLEELPKELPKELHKELRGGRPKEWFVSKERHRGQGVKDRGPGPGCCTYVSHGHDLYDVLIKHFEDLGFRAEAGDGYSMLVGTESGRFRPEIIRRARELDRSVPGGLVLMTGGGMMYLFLAKCYLETGEPDYKHSITPASLEGGWSLPMGLVADLVGAWRGAKLQNH